MSDTDYNLLIAQTEALLADEADALASAAIFVGLLYNAIPGHIVCDAESRSEIVVPLLINDALVGVLDIDSPLLDRFSDDDQQGIETLCRTYCDLQAGRPDFI